jgi:serine/threonine-protein kinase
MEGSPTRRLQAIGTPPPVRKEDFRIKEEKPRNNGEKIKADKLTVIFAIITAVIVIAISVYVGYSVVKPQLSSDKTSKDFEVKNYEGRNINEVLDELKQNGIKPEVKSESSKTVDKDVIIRQNPKEGVTLKPDGFGTLTLYVSSGPEQVNMPLLSKLEVREAERKLDDANIKYDIQYEFSDVAKDFVTKTDPAEGEKIEPGSTVIVYVSKGPEIKKTRVPNLLNMTESEAKKALAGAGLKIGKIYPEGSNYTGKITNQKPEATTEVDEDTPVDIYFSSSSATARTDVTKIITLDNPGNYPGDTVNIRVEATPSDTNVMEVLKNETVKKSDFPVRVSIPVPNGGKTNVKIFINNKDVLDDSVTLP